MKPDFATVDSAPVSTTCAPTCGSCSRLSALARGGCGRVVSLSGAPRLQRRLMALGLHPSAELTVLGRAPQGGAMELRAGTVHLMLRACEANGVLVEPTALHAHRVPEGAHALPTV